MEDHLQKARGITKNKCAIIGIAEKLAIKKNGIAEYKKGNIGIAKIDQKK